jgi:hypothetical protein
MLMTKSSKEEICSAGKMREEEVEKEEKTARDSSED